MLLTPLERLRLRYDCDNYEGSQTETQRKRSGSKNLP